METNRAERLENSDKGNNMREDKLKMEGSDVIRVQTSRKLRVTSDFLLRAENKGELIGCRVPASVEI